MPRFGRRPIPDGCGSAGRTERCWRPSRRRSGREMESFSSPGTPGRAKPASPTGSSRRSAGTRSSLAGSLPPSSRSSELSQAVAECLRPRGEVSRRRRLRDAFPRVPGWRSVARHQGAACHRRGSGARRRASAEGVRSVDHRDIRGASLRDPSRRADGAERGALEGPARRAATAHHHEVRPRAADDGRGWRVHPVPPSRGGIRGGDLRSGCHPADRVGRSGRSRADQRGL